MAITIFAQKIPDNIPKAYHKEFREVAKETKKLQKEYDVVLDPQEQIAIIPQSYDGSEVYNWANRNLAITENLAAIAKRAKRKVRVYIFDTAGEYDHPFLKNSAQSGFSYTGESSKKDGNGHSTHCAGIYGAYNNEQELGVARALAKLGLLELVPVKVLTNRGSGFYSWMTTATLDMIKDSKKPEHKGKFFVFSYSLGGGSSSPSFEEALKAAEAAGIAVVAAAGNGYGDGVDYPGNSQYTDAIAATTIENLRAGFSDHGPEVVFAAPGQDIVSTYIGGVLRSLSGTSMATPTEGAIYAIAASIYPTATKKQIRAHLIKHAVDLPPAGKDNAFGYGLSVITHILNNPIEGPDDPGDQDPPGDDDPTEPPTKATRLLTFDLPTRYTVQWKPNGRELFKQLKLKLQVRMKTNLYADDAARILINSTFSHFRNRFYVIQEDGDFVDAGYAVGLFYERLLKADYNLDVDIVGFWVESDKGHFAQPRNVPSLSARKVKKATTTGTY